MYNSHNTGIDKQLLTWLYVQSVREHWRVATWLDYDDLMQDGMLIAVKCRNKYGAIDDKIFAGKVRTAFHNHITDLANKRTTGKPLSPKRFGLTGASSPEKKLDDLTLSALVQSVKDDSTQFLAVVFSEAPTAIKLVISLFNDPAKLKLLRNPLKKGETLNKRLCNLVDQTPEIDLCAMIRGYFSGPVSIN